jgi:hypothetical protein
MFSFTHNSAFLVMWIPLLGTNSHLMRVSPHKNEEFPLWTDHTEIGIIKNIGSSRISVKIFPVHYALGGMTTDISVKSL